jgi:hypothetical protein
MRGDEHGESINDPNPIRRSSNMESKGEEEWSQECCDQVFSMSTIFE